MLIFRPNSAQGKDIVMLGYFVLEKFCQMILIVFAYCHVLLPFWVVFALETRSSRASLHVLEFRSCEVMVSGRLQSKWKILRQFRLKLAWNCVKQIFHYREISWFYFSVVPIQLPIYSFCSLIKHTFPSPHTLGAIVIPQVKVLVECGGQGIRYKSSGGSFTHICTQTRLK